MFWGITLENGKRYSQIVDSSFHVSMAALEQPEENAKKKGVSVMIEHEKSEFLLCTLNHGSHVQQPLDLNFIEGEEVTFFINGHGTVHLTGYVAADGENDDIDFDEDVDSGSNDEDNELEMNKSAKRKANLELQKSSKKAKVDSFFAEDSEASEDEDSDDDEDDEDMFINKNKSKKKKTPGKSPVAVITPSTQKNLANAMGSNKKKPKEELKTPQKKQQQQQGSAKKTPVNGAESVTQSGETSSKKKRKKKKKQQQQEGQQQESFATTPSPKQKGQQTPGASGQKGTPRKLKGGTTTDDITIGSGPVAKKGRFVSVSYVGRLKNNQVFDANKKEPLRFRLGAGEVIDGMDLGVEGMKVGGKRKIAIPSHQGYGNKGSGPIPPNSQLFFEVELKSVT